MLSIVRCAKCRYTLLESSALVGSHGFELNDERNCSYGQSQSVLFLNEEKLPIFVTDQVAQTAWTKGKLRCPKCQMIIGSHDYVQPRRCSCRTAQLPAVSLHSKKVDFLLKVVDVPEVERAAAAVELNKNASGKSWLRRRAEHFLSATQTGEDDTQAEQDSAQTEHENACIQTNQDITDAVIGVDNAQTMEVSTQTNQIDRQKEQDSTSKISKYIRKVVNNTDKAGTTVLTNTARDYNDASANSSRSRFHAQFPECLMSAWFESNAASLDTQYSSIFHDAVFYTNSHRDPPCLEESDNTNTNSVSSLPIFSRQNHVRRPVESKSCSSEDDPSFQHAHYSSDKSAATELNNRQRSHSDCIQISSEPLERVALRQMSDSSVATRDSVCLNTQDNIHCTTGTKGKTNRVIQAKMEIKHRTRNTAHDSDHLDTSGLTAAAIPTFNSSNQAMTNARQGLSKHSRILAVGNVEKERSLKDMHKTKAASLTPPLPQESVKKKSKYDHLSKKTRLKRGIVDSDEETHSCCPWAAQGASSSDTVRHHRVKQRDSPGTASAYNCIDTVSTNGHSTYRLSHSDSPELDRTRHSHRQNSCTCTPPAHHNTDSATNTSKCSCHRHPPALPTNPASIDKARCKHRSTHSSAGHSKTCRHSQSRSSDPLASSPSSNGASGHPQENLKSEERHRASGSFAAHQNTDCSQRSQSHQDTAVSSSHHHCTCRHRKKRQREPHLPQASTDQDREGVEKWYFNPRQSLWLQHLRKMEDSNKRYEGHTSQCNVKERSAPRTPRPKPPKPIPELVEDEDLCPVCYEILYRPHTVEPCKHGFCIACLWHLRRHMQPSNILCPMCRGPIQKCVANDDLRAQLKEKYPIAYTKRRDFVHKNIQKRGDRLPYTPELTRQRILLERGREQERERMVGRGVLRRMNVQVPWFMRSMMLWAFLIYLAVQFYFRP